MDLIYSVLIVFEDDLGNYAEFTCADETDVKKAIRTYRKIEKQCRGVPFHFVEIRYYETAESRYGETVFIDGKPYRIDRGVYDVLVLRSCS